MNPVTEKVLQRLNLEKILMTEGITPRRTRLTLEEVMKAGQEEPRIYEVLPALLLYKPALIAKQGGVRHQHADLIKVTENLFDENKRPHFFHGVETKDCAKAALTYRKFLEQKKSRLKSRSLTMRLAIEDIERLKNLSKVLGMGNVSETIRYLARKGEKEIT